MPHDFRRLVRALKRLEARFETSLNDRTKWLAYVTGGSTGVVLAIGVIAGITCLDLA